MSQVLIDGSPLFAVHRGVALFPEEEGGTGEPSTDFVTVDAGWMSYNDDAAHQWPVAPGGLGGTNEVTVTAGVASATDDDGNNFKWNVAPGGAGAAAGTIAFSAAGYGLITYGAVNYQWPTIPLA